MLVEKKACCHVTNSRPLILATWGWILETKRRAKYPGRKSPKCPKNAFLAKSSRVFFSQRSHKVFAPGKPKLLNLMTELFYSHILTVNWGSLHTRSFNSCIYTALFLDTDELRMALRAQKSFRAFREMGPRSQWV